LAEISRGLGEPMRGIDILSRSRRTDVASQGLVAWTAL